MSGDFIPTTTLAVHVQENGIIRAESDGRLLAKIESDLTYKEIQTRACDHVVYEVDEMEHILNCFDNLFYIHEQPPETQKEWREIIHKACHDARDKLNRVVQRRIAIKGDK